MTADTIDRIDHCPPGTERELLVEIIRETFAACKTPDPNFNAMLDGKLANFTDEQVQQMLSQMRDRLVQRLL